MWGVPPTHAMEHAEIDRERHVTYALSIQTLEGLLGPASRILTHLLRAQPLGGPEHVNLCLDVLVHAAGSSGGMLLDDGGYTLGRVGIADDLSAAFVDAWRSGMPRSLEQARLLHHSGVVSYTTVTLPIWAGATLVLASHDSRPIDTDALLALLPGVSCAIAQAPTLELAS